MDFLINVKLAKILGDLQQEHTREDYASHLILAKHGLKEEQIIALVGREHHRAIENLIKSAAHILIAADKLLKKGGK